MTTMRCLVLIVIAACDTEANAPQDSNTAPDVVGSCPTHLDFEAIGRDMRSDLGYTGVNHARQFPGGTHFTVKADCDSECRRCRISGPVAPDPTTRPISRRRCINDLTIACNSNADCPNGSAPDDQETCRFIYAGPLASAPPQPTNCTFFYFEELPGADPSPIQGVFDLQTGESDFTKFNIVLRQHFGTACPSCVNDPSPFDPSSKGVCTGGTDPGRACDVTAVSNGSPYTTSFDCPFSYPSALHINTATNNITTAQLSWTMDASRPMCGDSGFSSERCWCGQCSNTASPCQGDSDCNGGTCVGSGQVGPAGQEMTLLPTKPFNCNASGGVCNWDPVKQQGSCMHTFPPPAPPVPVQVGCFPNTSQITARGYNTVFDGYYVSTYASLQCRPGAGVTAPGGQDARFGLPGISFVLTPYRVTPKYF